MISTATLCLFALLPRVRKPIAFGAIRLVPSPKHFVRLKGSFRISDHTQIVFSDRYPEDRFAAEQLMEEVLTDAGERLESVNRQVGHAITLRRLRDPVSVNDQGQGYRLDVTPAGIDIAAQTADGIFYGVQTLKQLLRANRVGKTIPACRITDWPALKYRGWQHDISRGPIPTYSFLMKEIRTLAEFKLNMMTLYTEHVFKLKKHPTIAPPDGITAEEISDLCSYAKQFHVEVVGNFQSFGHFANILKTPGYEGLGENRGVLSPAKEESYKFLSDVYSEIAPAYSSPLFNINCDEVSGLGQGASKELVKQIGVGGVYARHINRIADLLRPYGKTPMMWGDIALHYPEIVPKLPKDLIVLPWAYDARASFESMILPFTKFGLRFMVCPGVSCWSQIWPDIGNASVNISNFIRDGAKNGALGSLNTAWDDDGMNFFDDNWYELAWGAQCSWDPALPNRQFDDDEAREAAIEKFNLAFEPVFYGLSGHKITQALIHLSELRKNSISGGMRNSAFFRNPLAVFAQLQPENLQTYLAETASIYETLKLGRAQAKHNALALDYALFAARRAAYLGESLAAVQAMQRFNLTPMRKLDQEARSLKDEYTDLWQRENRSWWLDRITAKYDALIAQIDKLAKSSD